MFSLPREWEDRLVDYDAQHRNPRNKACHRIGIPMILASLPIGATVIGFPVAATLFTVGWGFQFLGHHYEGNDPAFFSDRKQLITGALWWLREVGVVDKQAVAAE